MMPVAILKNPNEKAFEAAYEKVTGKRVAAGRAGKALRIASGSWDGKSVFGTCDLAWIGDTGDKRIVIGNGTPRLNLTLAPRIPGNNPPQPAACLVSENVGGIFAYFTEEDKAEEVAAALNALDPNPDAADDGPTYWVLSFDEKDHLADYQHSLIIDSMLVIRQGDDRIGYAIVENDETLKLYVV